MSGQPPGPPGGQYRPQGYGMQPGGMQPQGQRPQQGAPQMGAMSGAPPGMRPVAVRPGMGPGSPAAPGSGGSAASGSFGGAPRPLGSGQLQSRGSSGLGQQPGAPPGGGYGARPPAAGPGQMRPMGPGGAPMANGVGQPGMQQPRPGFGGARPSGPGAPQQPGYGGGGYAQPPRPQPGYGQPPPQQQQQQQPGPPGGPQQGYGAPQQPGAQPGYGRPPAPQQLQQQLSGGPPGSAPMGAQGMRPPGPPGMQPGVRPPGPPGQFGGRPLAPGGPRPMGGGFAPPGGAMRAPPGPPGAQQPGGQPGFGGPAAGQQGPYGAPQQQHQTPGPPAFGAPRPPSFGAPAGPPAFGGARPPPMGGDSFGTPRSSVPGGFGGAYDTQTAGLAAQFEQLALGQGQNPNPGQPPDTGPDVPHFPRPLGAAAVAGEAPDPPDPHSCDPAYLRPTTTCVPGTQTLRNRWQLPLGIIVHPLSNQGRPVPVAQMGSGGIVRCKRCRTYINPFVTWTDGGRRFNCNVCDMVNDVPSDYFAGVDMTTGRRTDEGERPELSQGSVEYIAPSEYMVRAPMPPVYFFAIDVSAEAVASGVLPLVCETIKSCLDRLPGDERTQIGFVTYDAHVHFYNLKAGLQAPQMVVMSDVEDPFVPLPDDLLVNLAESRSVVEALLDSLPATFAANSQTESALGPTLQTVFLIMSGTGGKLLVFQSTPPSVGVGRTKQRDNPAAYGTDREPLTRKPEDPFFKKYSAEASRVQIALDIFCMATQYTDLASLGPLAHYTCGQVCYYPGFVAERDGAKLRAELTHNLTRETGWEAVMRVRCSRGLRVSSFHGPFFVRSTDLLALPQVDPDKAFAVQMVLEDNVVNSTVSYVQCALLYTNSNGERRIRVHTMSMPVVGELAPLYAGADQGAIAALLAKLGVERSLHQKLDQVRTELQTRVMQGLKDFRAMHAQHFRSHHRIIWPASLRMLPLYTLGLSKCAAFRGGQRDVAVDERMAVSLAIQGAGVDDILRLAYPTLLAIHDPSRGLSGDWGGTNDAGQFLLPPALSLESAQLSAGGAYLLDNGRVFLLWLGAGVPVEYVAQLFGVAATAVPNEVHKLPLEPAKDNPESKRFNALLGKLREGRALHQQVFVVKQGTPLEARMGAYMVEDATAGGPSYGDYLLQLHKSVLSAKPTK